jgi:hypothetical protein
MNKGGDRLQVFKYWACRSENYVHSWVGTPSLFVYGTHFPAPRSPERSLSFSFYNQHFRCIYHLPMRATCPTHHVMLNVSTVIISGEEYELWTFRYAVFSILLCHFIQIL